VAGPLGLRLPPQRRPPNMFRVLKWWASIAKSWKIPSISLC
jgi:hypothetical protein